MQTTPPRSNAASSPGRDGAAAWLVATAVGVILAITLALVGPMRERPVLVNGLVSAGVGWGVSLLFVPWGRVRAWRRDRADLRRLLRQVRRLGDDAGNADLDRLILPRRDELGELSVAIRDALEQSLSNRRAARRLKRDLGDSIRRETHRQTARLRKEANTDALTGLGNRRALDQCIESLNGQDPPPATVVAMIADMDHFKQVNDSLGHDIGDDCLRFLGDLLSSSVRREDTAVRHGGDEFVVLMPGQTIAHARLVAERLSTLFNQMPWPHADVTRPSLSIGLACVPFEALADGRVLLQQADQALYRAKREGRARVQVYADRVMAA